MNASLRSTARTVMSPLRLWIWSSSGCVLSTGIESPWRISKSVLPVTLLPPGVVASFDWSPQNSRPINSLLLSDDLDPLSAVVDIDQGALEATSQAFSDRLFLRQILRHELRGDIQARFDQAERKGEIDGGFPGLAVRHSNSNLSCRGIDLWRCGARRLRRKRPVERLQQRGGLLSGDRSGFEQME